MAKRAVVNEIEQVQPVGLVIEPAQPLPVTVMIRWTLDLRESEVENAWCIAWTSQAVCVYWFTPGMHNPDVVWLKPSQVTRR